MAALETVAVLKKDNVPVTLMIVGRLAWAGAVQMVMARVRDLDLEDVVEVRGAYRQEEAPDIYRSADILLHLKYADPCPSVVLEAMASGLPVIGSYSGGLPELVGENGVAGGILIPVAQDMKELHIPSADTVADAVKRVCAGYVPFRVAARQRAVEMFDTRRWLTRHAEIFKQVLQR